MKAELFEEAVYLNEQIENLDVGFERISEFEALIIQRKAQNPKTPIHINLNSPSYSTGIFTLRLTSEQASAVFNWLKNYLGEELRQAQSKFDSL
jgi:hypothetical protein